MKIKTRFSITIFLFGLIIACVLIFLAIMDNHVKKSGEQDELAKNISQGAMELNYLANDYLIHREDRQIERWRASFARFSARMANLKPETANEKQLVKHMVADVRQLELTFDDVLTGIQHFPNNQSDGYLFSELFSVSSSRLAVQTQGLFSDSQRLNGLIRSRLDRLANIRTFLVYAILFLFAIFLLANYTFTYRRIMRSVALLRAGMKIIGAGDPTDSLYIVINGRLKVLMSDEQGREVILSILGPGEVFGEMSLIDMQPRSASVAVSHSAHGVAVSIAIASPLGSSPSTYRFVAIGPTTRWSSFKRGRPRA